METLYASSGTICGFQTSQSLVFTFIETIALSNDSGLVNVIPGSHPGLDGTSFSFLKSPNAFYALPRDMAMLSFFSRAKRVMERPAVPLSRHLHQARFNTTRT